MSEPTDGTRSRQRVFIATVSVGAGHWSVARALVERFARDAPDIEVDCRDALDFVPKAFRWYYRGMFVTGMVRLPGLYGLVYRLTDRPQRPARGVMERFRLWVERLFLRRLRRHLLDTRPSLVLCTHFLPTPMIGRMIARGELDSPQAVVVTDICVHRFWHSENVAHWFAPAESSAETLERWGHAPADVTVSGIPIHPKWTVPVDAAGTRADFGLPDDRPVVILTAGTEFICGPVKAIARDLLDACPDLHLVALAGRDDELRVALEAMPEAGARMTVIGYTDRLHELVEVSRLVITKAGGVTTFECLAKGKPMVIPRPVPGHEAGNARHYADHGAAVVVRNPREVAARVRELLASPSRLDAMADAAGQLHRPGARTVVRYATETLGTGKGDTKA